MSGTYTVTVTDNKGCSGTSSVTATVNPSLNVSTAAPEVCAGSTLSITSTPSGGTSPYTYSWSGPNGYTSSTQNISRANATVTMSGTYTVTVTDNKGCSGTSSVTATVNPSLNVSTAAPEVCAGSTLSITSTPSGGTSPYTYSWSGPNGYTSSTQNISRANATVTMSGTYTVTVTDNKGCSGTKCVCYSKSEPNSNSRIKFSCLCRRKSEFNINTIKRNTGFYIQLDRT
ncbi:MAG: hypothetical protein IPN49_10825 [Saprospiraceae bacterium]|nr:hypothetical protein [Saprospiraceae bacterium]